MSTALAKVLVIVKHFLCNKLKHISMESTVLLLLVVTWCGGYFHGPLWYKLRIV